MFFGSEMLSLSIFLCDIFLIFPGPGEVTFSFFLPFLLSYSTRCALSLRVYFLYAPRAEAASCTSTLSSAFDIKGV